MANFSSVTLDQTIIQIFMEKSSRVDLDLKKLLINHMLNLLLTKKKSKKKERLRVRTRIKRTMMRMTKMMILKRKERRLRS
jgi:hypothetical protein